MSEPVASLLGRNIIQSTFCIHSSSNHTFISLFSHQSTDWTKKQQRQDRLPTCMPDVQRAVNIMEDAPANGILTGEEHHPKYIHSSSNHTFIHPSVHLSIEPTKKQQGKDRLPTCVFDDETGTDIAEDVPASSLGKNIIQSTVTLPATHPPTKLYTL